MVRAVALVALATLSACSDDMTKTMTQPQALTRVDQLIRESAESLIPRPRLELVPYSVPPNPCVFDDAGQPQRFSINRKYWLRDIPVTENITIANQVVEEWKRRGHVIVSRGGWAANKPGAHARTEPDGFLLALAWTEGDNLYLAATSPCLPSETSH